MFLQHTLLKRVLGGLCKAPVHRILSSCKEHSIRPNVLEIGCGQGSWYVTPPFFFTHTRTCMLSHAVAFIIPVLTWIPF